MYDFTSEMEMLRIDPQNKNSDSKKSVRFKTAYLFQLVPLINDDEVDRLPMCTRVGWFDLACHAFSMSTYISDMVLDIWVAIQHYNHHRFLAALLTVIFVAVPSVIINIISLLWWLDDRSIRQENHETDVTDNIILRERLERLSRFKKPKKPKSIEITEADFVPDLKAKRSQTIHWILCTVFQVGPLIWHARALKSAYTCMQIQKLPRRERILFHRMYLKMIEADRDASVLRFFEALLESLPQLLIQGYFLIDDVVKAGSLTEFDWKLLQSNAFC
ncbi:XK-related protein [Aphelenchoides bicaudatus]|nr:XK-related protein [Aphelenchoides bicaudatus]